jgi:fumarate hydratase class II
MNPATSRAAVRSMATLTHAARAANPAARTFLSAAARLPMSGRALSSNTRQLALPRLQSLNNRAFSTTVNMVGCASQYIGEYPADLPNLVFRYPC